MPSRPGEFHPESLTEPDLILSHHPARAIARRLPPSAERSGSSRFDPVGPSSTAMTRPLCSTGITPLRRYYGAVRPSPAHRYFRPRGWRRLCLFPWHRRPGSHVPYKSLIELRAAYTPDAARSGDRHPTPGPGGDLQLLQERYGGHKDRRITWAAEANKISDRRYASGKS